MSNGRSFRRASAQQGAQTRERNRRADTRIVYGAGCSWWDSIDKVSKNSGGLPCCPHCGSVLFEVASEVEWWAGVNRFEAEGHAGYRAFIEWLRGQCFPSYQDALAEYEGTVENAEVLP